MTTPEPRNGPTPHARAGRPAILHACALITILIGSCHALAQPVFDPPDPGRVVLSPEPLTIEGLGLQLTPPAGHELTTNTIGGLVTATIKLPDNLGVISAQPHQYREARSIFQIEESVIKELLRLPEAASGLTIDTQIESGHRAFLGRSPFVNGANRIIRPFYFLLGLKETRRVRGVAIVPITQTNHVMFSLTTREAQFDRAREVFEVMLGTVLVPDVERIDESRGRAIRAGAQLLDALTRAEYDAIVSDVPEQFERIYRPAPGGAEHDEIEVGYRRLRAWIGPRGDLDRREPSRTPQDPPTPEDGYLLRLDGLVFLDGGNRADSRAIYYLSRDRTREAWTVEMAIRGPGRSKPEIWTEIGARSGDSMTVRIKQAGKASRTARPLIEGEGYISRLELTVLPQLLIRAGEPGEFAFYSYDQAAEANRLRFVTLEQPDDRPGLWTVTTRRVDGQSETAEYNAYARLIQSKTTDGLIKRPIEFERLYRIWQSKGLPLD